MKIVSVSETVTIETPWLRGVEEAAAYCGMSVTAFRVFGDRLPHHGQGRLRLYHIETLDAWLAGELPGVPAPGKPTGTRADGKARVRRRRKRLPLRNPKTGKVYE